MSFVSYAQNFEDVILWRALCRIKKGFYVDIGAAWPVKHSITKAFYDHGWHGINIEPNPSMFEQLKTERTRDVNLQISIGNKNETSWINLINDTGLSTLNNDIAQKHKADKFTIERSKTKVITLSTLWTQHIKSTQEVHFLKVDVEGHENCVIEGNNWNKNRPWILIIEATKPLSQEESFSTWEPILIEANFLFAYADGLNRFYVADERIELLQHFKYPPNVFDDFITSDLSKKNYECHFTETIRHQLKKICTEKEQLAVKLERKDRVIDNYEQSLSWSLTRPLRLLNPKRLLSLKNKSLHIIFFDYLLFQKNTIKSNSYLWRFIKNIIIRSTQSRFLKFQITNNIQVNFCRGPLTDNRGIGRVTQELINEFNLKYKKNKQIINYHTINKIFFYPSIHWCPLKTPYPSVVMIHDVIPLLFQDYFPKAVIHEWLNHLKPIAQQADRIVTISNSSANDIAKLLDISKEKITVIYDGIRALPISTKPTILLPEKPFIVFLGSNDHHKNLGIIFKALTDNLLLDIHLVMIGDNSSCKPLIQKMNLSDRVHFLGHLRDEDIGWVLKCARALVFPSLYEGFGLPPLEAALLGTPSVCSRRPAMTELLKDCALFAEPDDTENWVSAIHSIVYDQTINQKLSINAHSRAKLFKWSHVVESLEKVFISLIIDRDSINEDK